MAAAIDPIDRKYFDEVIKPHVDGEGVVFHGEVSASTLIELYGGARVVLFPISWHEPFGLVMIEAMACGTPVVVRAAAGLGELVAGGAGTGVESGQPAAWAEAIAATFTADRRRVAAAVRARAEAFDWERVMPAVLERYRRLIGARPVQRAA